MRTDDGRQETAYNSRVSIRMKSGDKKKKKEETGLTNIKVIFDTVERGGVPPFAGLVGKREGKTSVGRADIHSLLGIRLRISSSSLSHVRTDSDRPEGGAVGWLTLARQLRAWNIEEGKREAGEGDQRWEP